MMTIIAELAFCKQQIQRKLLMNIISILKQRQQLIKLQI